MAKKVLFWEQEENGRINPIESNKIDISNGLTAEYNTQVELLTDPNFDNWSVIGLIPSDWETMNFGNTSASRSTDKHSGDYAVELTSDAAFEESFLSELFGGGDAGSLETLQLKVWAKGLTGVPNLFYIYQCDAGEDTYYYNFTGENVGTWTIPGGEGPDATQLGSIPITSEYTELVGELVTIPDGASGGVTMFGVASALTGATAVLDDVEILVETVNVAQNASFEDWEPIEGLTDWDTGNYGDDGEATTFTKESTIKRAGNYSVKSTGNNGQYSYVAELVEGGTPDAEAYTSIFGRGDSGNQGTPAVKKFILNNELDQATQIWDFQAEEWINTQGEYFDWEDDLNEDTRDNLAIGNNEEWAEAGHDIVFPATGKIYMVAYTEISTDEDIVYMDTASVESAGVGYGDIVTVDIDGKMTVDGEIACDDATGDGSVVNLGQLKEVGTVILGSALVDMTTIATTTIYGEPTNSIPLFVVQVCEEVSDYLGGPVWQMGTNNPDYNDLISPGTVAPYSEGVARTTYLDSSNVLQPTEKVAINVTTGSDATTHNVRCYIFGIKV